MQSPPHILPGAGQSPEGGAGLEGSAGAGGDSTGSPGGGGDGETSVGASVGAGAAAGESAGASALSAPALHATALPWCMTKAVRLGCWASADSRQVPPTAVRSRGSLLAGEQKS